METCLRNTTGNEIQEEIQMGNTTKKYNMNIVYIHGFKSSKLMYLYI